jgi:hypothetical protein
MRRLWFFCLLLSLSSLLGCIYIPHHVYINRESVEENLKYIEENVTTKEQVLLALGAPDRVKDNERVFLYWWAEVYGELIGYQSFEELRSLYALKIEFDDNDIVKKLVKEKKGVLGTRVLKEFYSEW